MNVTSCLIMCALCVCRHTCICVLSDLMSDFVLRFAVCLFVPGVKPNVDLDYDMLMF